MTGCHALAQRAACWRVFWQAGRGLRSGERRERLFAEYFRTLLRQLPQSPGHFVVESNVRLAEKRGGLATHEICLKPPEDSGFLPGDLLYVAWQNPESLVEEVAALLGPPPSSRLRVWGAGSSFSPSRRLTVEPMRLLGEILDLAVPSPALLRAAARCGCPVEAPVSLAGLLRRCPALARWDVLVKKQARMAPRIYTVAGMPGPAAHRSTVDLLVSSVRAKFADFPMSQGRGSGFLTGVSPGTVVRAHRLAHPHRLPRAHGHSGPGLVIVTGSAIAGPLAFLRARAVACPLWIIWGMSSRETHFFYADEFALWQRSGPLARLDLVESAPSGGRPACRIPEFLESRQTELAEWMAAGAWVYVSGQNAMAAAAREKLAAVLAGSGQVSDPAAAHRQIAQWEADMRFVESASG